MKPRRPSFNARAAEMLDRMAFALEAVQAVAPKRPGSDPATPHAFAPSVSKLADEARALVAEHRERQHG